MKVLKLWSCEDLFVVYLLGKELCAPFSFYTNFTIMEFKAKNKFFRLVSQFETHNDGGLHYNGYPIQERGTVEANLKFAFEEFKPEFENNLLQDKALTYIEILRTALSSIRSEIEFLLEENVLSYRKPLTVEEFPEEMEREAANKSLKEQYILNQLPLLEQIVKKQLIYIALCEEYINTQKENIIGAAAIPISTTQPVIPATVDIPKEQSVSETPLKFHQDKNHVVLFNYILNKKEIIDNRPNELMHFIQRNYLYWNNSEKKYKPITGVATLINQFTFLEKNPKPVQEEILKMLDEVKTEIDVMIGMTQNIKIDKEVD
jgi:hypothetical protein